MDNATFGANCRRQDLRLAVRRILDSAGGVGMVEPEALGAIAEGLAGDNLTDVQIRGILRENWPRIATRVRR
jgi:hypothetical protein